MIMADQLDSKPGRRKVALALQGGGSHGAFTWGVLDRSLEEPTIDIMIEESDKGRIPQLVPLRHGRMLESLITFYCGAALNMAADLATMPATGVRVRRVSSIASVFTA
jgi:Uncharacterized protein conserved in bacteria (DUF2252)